MLDRAVQIQLKFEIHVLLEFGAPKPARANIRANYPSTEAVQ